MKGHLTILSMIGLALGLGQPAWAQAAPVLIGEEWTYQVKPNERLGAIVRRYGLDLRRIRAINRLSYPKQPVAGQLLHLSNRHIVPAPEGTKLLINIPDLLLFRFEDDRLVAYYPVALGEPRDAEFPKNPKRWQSPLGSFTIAEKRKNPVWNIPKSIQEEREAEGKERMSKMPPGPKNPLGQYWIGLSKWGYGIHGTIAPSSVGQFKTHGCVRMKPQHIEAIFGAVSTGDVVRIAYEPVKVMASGGRVWLEIAGDAYKRIDDLGAYTRRRLAEAGVLSRVDPERVSEAIRRHWGVAVRVERGAPRAFPKIEPESAQ